MRRTSNSRPLALVSGLSLLASVIGGIAVSDGVASEAGETLYAEHCASCHGARLEGQSNWQSPLPDGTLPAPPHDDSGHTWHHGDRLLFDYTKFGGAAALRMRGAADFKSGMPAFGEILTDDEIRTILGFIKSSWGDRERAYQATMSAQEE